MKRIILLAFLALSGVAYGQQQQIYCNLAAKTPCTPTWSQYGVAGDKVANALGKANVNFSQLYSMFGVTGVLYGNGAVPNALTAATASNIIALWSNCASGTPLLSYTGSCVAGGSGSGVSSLTGDGALFTNSASTGAVTLTLGSAPAYGVWGNDTASSGAPAYTALSSWPLAAFPTLNQNTTGTAANITATLNSTLTTLSALSLPVSQLTGVLPIANGGNGTGTPTLTAGTNVTLTGSWPDYTISASSTASTAFSALTGSTNQGIAAPVQAAPVVNTATSTLPASTAYYFEIVEHNSNGTTTVSNQETATTSATANDSTISLSWTAGAGGTGTSYDVWYSTSSSMTSPAYYNTTATSYTFSAAAGTAGTIPTANTTGASMLVGNYSSVAPTGSGTVSANQVNGAAVPASAALTATNSSGQFTVVTLGSGFTINSGTLLPTYTINAQTATTYTVATTDCSGLLTFNNAAAIAVNLPAASGSFAGCSFDVQDLGAGAATITPASGTVNGAADIVVGQNYGCTLTSDGTNWQVSACTAVAPSSSGGLTPSGSPAQYDVGVFASGTSLAGIAPGASGTCFMSNGSAANPSFQTCPSSGGGTAENVQIFTTSGSWTKPTGSPQTTNVWCVGGGGGGGSGDDAAATIPPGGGGGGGGAEAVSVSLATANLPSPITVTIGAGGNGGAASTSGGNAGSAGNPTTFGTYLTAVGGGAGGAGGPTGSQGGNGAGLFNLTGVCSSSGTAGGAGQGASCTYGGSAGGGSHTNTSGGGSANIGGSAINGGSGGGSGGTVTTNSTATAGGASGSVMSQVAAAGGSGAVGSSGVQGTGAYEAGTGGGGGGASATANGFAGGAGGPGGGGGGGGAAVTGFSSGAGGNGGNGECVAVTVY